MLGELTVDTTTNQESVQWSGLGAIPVVGDTVAVTLYPEPHNQGTVTRVYVHNGWIAFDMEFAEPVGPDFVAPKGSGFMVELQSGPFFGVDLDYRPLVDAAEQLVGKVEHLGGDMATAVDEIECLEYQVGELDAYVSELSTCVSSLTAYVSKLEARLEELQEHTSIVATFAPYSRTRIHVSKLEARLDELQEHFVTVASGLIEGRDFTTWPRAIDAVTARLTEEPGAAAVAYQEGQKNHKDKNDERAECRHCGEYTHTLHPRGLDDDGGWCGACMDEIIPPQPTDVRFS